MFYAAIFAIVFTAAGRAEERATAAISKQEIQAKLDYCKTCHGLSGQGYRGYYPMPRLAGQQPKYIENQLRAFIERRRMNPVMFNVAHALSPSMVAALTTYFQDLNPSPLGGGPQDHLALEKQFSRRDYPKPTFLRALLVMDRRRRVKTKFLGWQVSSFRTRSKN